MKSLIKMIRVSMMNSIVRWIKQYSVIKYGHKSDICVLTAGPLGSISFQTSNTSGLIKKEAVNNIRRLVGENILTVCGVPLKGEAPPNVILIISPSALFSIGFKVFELIKNWKGTSMVGDLPVITYTMK